MSKKSIGAHPYLYPGPIMLVGTYDSNGKPNIAAIAWAGVCNAEPVLVGLAVRPSRYTHSAIVARKAFTVSFPTQDMVAATDFAGLASGRNIDKFTRAGLTPAASEVVDAPYVAECPVILECSLHQQIEFPSHTYFIGEVRDIKADQSCLSASGKYPDMMKFMPMAYDNG
ncbi:MAG: flavin reductase family protein, partial [Deltaproteobacteria bacterium]|nr:flavin reductase family protein [Deltaproteobacteria bacterium]